MVKYAEMPSVALIFQNHGREEKRIREVMIYFIQRRNDYKRTPSSQNTSQWILITHYSYDQLNAF
jgi:hypothetical protein